MVTSLVEGLQHCSLTPVNTLESLFLLTSLGSVVFSLNLTKKVLKSQPGTFNPNDCDRL